MVLDRAALQDLRLKQQLRAGRDGVTLNDLDQIGKHDGGLWVRSVLDLSREAK